MRVKIPPKLSVQQKKAMEYELYNQIAEGVRNLSTNFTAIVLWQLHEQEGYGKTKLLRFYKNFVPKIKELQDYYEMHSVADTEWLCKYKLKEMGIDLDNMDDILNIKVAYKK